MRTRRTRQFALRGQLVNQTFQASVGIRGSPLRLQTCIFPMDRRTVCGTEVGIRNHSYVHQPECVYMYLMFRYGISSYRYCASG